MNECWNFFRLRITQYRKGRISAYSYYGIGAERLYYLTHLHKTFYNLKWQRNIFNQRTSVKSCYVKPLLFHIPTVALFPFPSFLLHLQIKFLPTGLLFKAFAIATAEIYAPVPPPAMIIRLFIRSVVRSSSDHWLFVHYFLIICSLARGSYDPGYSYPAPSGLIPPLRPRQRGMV